MYSASSPSSSTDITDISDIFPLQSPSNEQQQHHQLSISTDILSSCTSTAVHLRSPPSVQSDRKLSGKSTRVKRGQCGTSNKPYRRTVSPVFPDGSVPISALSQQPNHINSKQLLPCTSYQSHCSPLVMKLDHHYIDQLQDIERKLLKLHSEKAKLIQSAHDSSELTIQDSQAKGKFLVSVLPTGQAEFDNGFIEEVNSLLLTIGGLYSSFESATNKVISLCSSAQPSINSISDCCPYVTSLLSSYSTLKLQEDPSSKIVQVECKSTHSNDPVSPSLIIMLEAVNQVMELAQSIQHQGHSVDIILSFHLEKLSYNSDCIDSILSSIVTSVEARSNICSVLKGNHAILTSVQKIWQQKFQVATDTMITISESLTDSNNK